jgi:hypothetical protein
MARLPARLPLVNTLAAVNFRARVITRQIQVPIIVGKWLEARLETVMRWQLDGGIDPMQHRGDVHRDMRADGCNWIHG